jgi:stearoyl-CoA desaturase (Delta-9 desaturase)
MSDVDRPGADLQSDPELQIPDVEITPLPVADPIAELPRREVDPNDPERLSLGMRIATFITVVVPIGGLLAGMISLWGWGFSWVDFGLLVGMYVLTALGITVGFHRLFTHRSFETNGVVKAILGILGSMAVQGTLLHWVAVHRRHHQFSDKAEDPHSPHHHGRGILGLLQGVWHAHLGWIFEPDPPDLDRYNKDLRKSRLLRVISALFLVWIALGLALPMVLGGVLTGTWTGAWLGLVWGGLVRIFLVHHVTWSINSVCHLWGRRPYRSDDESRDNLIFGIVGMGEGWHHTHHTFPTSARHGLRWWQIDVSYWVIRTLAFFGLAWNVKVPTRQAQDQLKAKTVEPSKDQPQDS